VFQFHFLLPEFTSLDNVLLPMRAAGIMSEADMRERGLALLGSLGLAEHANKRPNQLSGGQRQRVAIARALSNRPEIIVADEPTGALDTKSTEQVFSILRDIADQGQTVVVVTHDPALAARADRRIHIVDGKIAEVTARVGREWFARRRVRSRDCRSRYKISKTTPCKVGWGQFAALGRLRCCRWGDPITPSRSALI
jgi:lipoprotein-releasing system ATP-binding protein